MALFRNALFVLLGGWLLVACASVMPPVITQSPVGFASTPSLPTPTLPLNDQPLSETGQGAPDPALTAPSEAPPTAAANQAQPSSALPAPENSPAAPTQAASAELPAMTPTTAILPGPDCAIGLPPTRPDMEGPYFLAGSPEKASLIEPGMSGTPLTISGYVMTVDCKWIPGAKLEFWQADANGEYDLRGYRLRGHVFTDENGRYQIETILPAPYETRPRHIHVMVIPPGQPGLTTQLYFPGDSPYPELTVALRQESQAAVADFNFVLEYE